MDASDYRRENEDWDLNSPDLEEEGRRANALFQYLVGIGELQEYDEEDLENLTRLKSKKFELEKQKLFKKKKSPEQVLKKIRFQNKPKRNPALSELEGLIM